MDADVPLHIGSLHQQQQQLQQQQLLHPSARFAASGFGFGAQAFTQALAAGGAYSAALYYAASAAAPQSPLASPPPPQLVTPIVNLTPTPMPMPPPPPHDAQWAALKSRRWSRGKDLTAFVQDLALQSGKRAVVATSGGSYKKFVCSSASACPWLINAVCSRPRKRPREKRGRACDDLVGAGMYAAKSLKDDVSGSDRYWYITSGHLTHENCSSAAKPTARQLKNSSLLQAAVQDDSRVSSAVLVERLKVQEQLVCSKSMVYKAKTDLLDELSKTEGKGGAGLDATEQLRESIHRLPSYLAQMSVLNPHVMSCVERDEDGCFLRAVLAMDPTGVWNDQSVLGVDSCEMHHRGYNGTELALVGRDGNLAPIVHAIALVPEESPEHCTWFLEKLIAHGFPLRRFPLFTNGRWGFSAACVAQQVPHAMCCTQHLIADMGEHQSITLRGDQEALVWKAQQAETEADFVALLNQLAQLHYTAAHYVKSLDPKRWALFPYVSLRKMYGWQTTLLPAVDHGRTMGLAPQSQPPYEFFKAMSLVLMNGTFQRHERAVQWEREHRVVTPEAERLMQDELKLVPMYSVAMSTPFLAFVWNANEPQIRQRRVDLQHRTCTCAFRMQWGVPCRHILAVLQKAGGGLGMQPYEYFDECYLVRNYASSFKGRYLELPLEETVQRDPTLLPARLVAKTAVSSTATSAVKSSDDSQNSSQSSQEQPPRKKRRIRNRPLEERKRGVYKCHRCHRADGHNKGSCPYQLPLPEESIGAQPLVQP